MQRWLAAGAERVRANGAVLVVRQGSHSTIVGLVPQDDEPDSGLLAAATRAFREHRVIQRIGEPASGENRHVSVNVAFGLRVFGRPAAVAFALRVPDGKTDDAVIAEIASEILRRAEDSAAAASSGPQAAEPLAGDTDIASPLDGSSHLAEANLDAALSSPADAVMEATPAESTPAGAIASPETSHKSLNGSPSAVPAPRPYRAEVDADESAEQRRSDEKTALLIEQSAVIGALATVLDQHDFAQSLHAFANGIARNWGCLRVTVGLVRSRRIAIEAVSGVVDFDPRSALMVDISQALQETHAAASVIVLPADKNGEAPPQAHVSLAAQLKNPALLSLPLVDRDQLIGALLLERDHAFSEMEQLQLQRMALLLGPVIALKRLESLGPLHWLKRFAGRQLRALLGSSALGWKLAAIAACAFVIWSSLYTQVFKVDAEAIIEASVHRAVVANIPSFLTEVEKKAGDIVHEGDVLARLDVEDLQLERIKWIGERDKLAKEYRANLAQRDRSNVRILEARRAQAQSQIDLLDAQIERATLRAPLDGVVISGDLSQVIGTPVERGQLLFEVASLDDYRLTLMVDESDIGWVDIGQQGSLRLRSLPDQSFPLTVAAITPVSEAGEGANRFRVEATLSGLPDSLRPGMEGVAKIDIEPRAVGWIWTRSFVNWLRFQSWKYGW